MVSDRRGDIDADPDQPQGLFFRDTRFLSRWRLTVGGKPLDILSTDDVDYFSAQFFLVPPTGTIYRNPSLSVIRWRFVSEGFHEDLLVMNHSPEPVTLDLRLEAGADFADLFEVKDALEKAGTTYAEVRDAFTLVLGYRREDFVRETAISSSAEPDDLSETGMGFTLEIEPNGKWQTCLEIVPTAGEHAGTLKYDHDSFGHAHPNMVQSLEEWVEGAPVLETDWDYLRHAYAKSLVDLASLRFYPDFAPGQSVPAAGLPWFMTLFGRDSLMTSYQALPFAPELATTTLRVLAAKQGTKVDDFRDEEPGKILHELRVGELTHFNERPHSPYYGTADATPLWLVLLEEAYRWTGDAALASELEASARAALEWIDTSGNRRGDGFLWYERRNTETGLENQCWKDSWNSILFADGSMSALPRATCELQGYVYDAKVRIAGLAREVWGDAALAGRLEAEAAELKARFNDAFWIPDRECYALALDGDGRQVDSLTSNIGHLLWSGIVDDDKVDAVAEHLVGDKLFSGWGVRTMAEGEGGYNPIEYHNGTVWPHDNGFIALGLARAGHGEKAASIARSILEASTFFEYRLPEVFAGYPRELTRFPVQYPTASSPQAWATGTPLLLLRVLLGLEVEGERLRSSPVPFEGVERIALRRIAGPWGEADVEMSS